MTERRHGLLAAMGGSGKAEIAARVARLFLRFPSAAKTDAEATTAAYATDLMTFPLWAIDRGIMDAIENWKSAFAPSSPELRAMVAAAAKPYFDELADLASILDAQVFHEPDETEKERVSAGFANLIADLRLHEPLVPGRPRQPTRDEGAEWLDANRGAPLPQLSPDALIRMGVSPSIANRKVPADMTPDRAREIFNGETTA